MPEFVDPYLDPVTGLLRNIVGATSRDVLDVREAELIVLATAELSAQPVAVTGGLRQLTEIHLRLFRNVYEWAGQLRTVDIRKDTYPGAEFFMPASRLRSGAGFAFQELADDNVLRGFERGVFVDRIAHHYDQVNYLHPFREGNGRAQRMFWSQIAAGAGYDLDWRKTDGSINDQASRAAMERQDLTGLRVMFDTITSDREGDTGAVLEPELQRIVDTIVRDFGITATEPRPAPTKSALEQNAYRPLGLKEERGYER